VVALLAGRPAFSAEHRFARIAPRKMRLVVDLIKGRNYNSALAILRTSPRRGAAFALKLLKSAFANASYEIRRQKLDIDPESLCLVEARVDTGRIVWGLRPSSMRRPQYIHRRTSHIRFVLQELPAAPEAAAPPRKPEPPPEKPAAPAAEKSSQAAPAAAPAPEAKPKETRRRTERREVKKEKPKTKRKTKRAEKDRKDKKKEK
jgi:large subunit ribosomal protein L22